MCRVDRCNNRDKVLPILIQANEKRSRQRQVYYCEWRKIKHAAAAAAAAPSIAATYHNRVG